MDNDEDVKNFPPTTQKMCKSGCGSTASSLCDGQCKRCYNITLTTQLRESVGSKLQHQRQQQQQQQQVDENTSNESDKDCPNDLVQQQTQDSSLDSTNSIIDSSSLHCADERVMQNEPTECTSSADNQITSLCVDNLDINVVPSKAEKKAEINIIPEVDRCENTANIVEQSNPAQPESTGKTKKDKGNRCAQCRKKLRLTNMFTCNCEMVFCPVHRYAEEHNCSFNYKKAGSEQIARLNPVILAEKVRRF